MKTRFKELDVEREGNVWRYIDAETRQAIGPMMMTRVEALGHLDTFWRERFGPAEIPSQAFRLEIDTTNAAFDCHANGEIARILRQVAERLEQGRNDGPMFDVNGNCVGTYSFGAADE